MHIVDKRNDRPNDGMERHSEHHDFSSSSEQVPAVHIDTKQLVPIHLQIHPVTHEGAKTFTNNFPDIGAVLESAVHTCWDLLYNNESHLLPENVRSITLFVRSIPGVAYTTGNWLDGDNKEIHLSMEYVRDQSPARTRDEIRGVIIHEMVHVWQNNGHGTAPSGLIEGIADFVRLRAGLAPPHWRRGRGERWDEGYEVTGYFLDWIEKRYAGFVRGVNAILRDAKWDVGVFKLITGQSVDDLWKEYRKELDEIFEKSE